jgi:hypothetical protein
MAREGVSPIVIQCQLGHTNLGITSIYTQGIDLTEIIDSVDAGRPPMVPVDATLRCDRVAPRSSSETGALRDSTWRRGGCESGPPR